jgi:DNA-binding NtrC family response regulator
MTKRILLVDDEEVVLDVVSEMLESEGYQVEARDNGLAALAAFSEDPTGFDLVITDHLMSELPGLRLAEKIFQIRPEIPIILFTGGDSGVEPEAEAVGIRSIIKKPIAMGPLIDTVKRALLS